MRVIFSGRPYWLLSGREERVETLVGSFVGSYGYSSLRFYVGLLRGYRSQYAYLLNEDTPCFIRTSTIEYIAETNSLWIHGYQYTDQILFTEEAID